MAVSEINIKFAAKRKEEGMEFIVIFCILCALVFGVTALGVAAGYVLKGMVAIVGAICIGIARLLRLLQRLLTGLLGLRVETGQDTPAWKVSGPTEKTAATLALIIIFIVITAWIANVT